MSKPIKPFVKRQGAQPPASGGRAFRTSPSCAAHSYAYASELLRRCYNPLRILQAATAENQAWQRSGRGYSAGMSKIPYLYVAEIGGFELDTNTRERKAARLPNATVPFSYLTYSHENSPMLPIYEKISAFMTNIS